MDPAIRCPTTPASHSSEARARACRWATTSGPRHRQRRRHRLCRLRRIRWRRVIDGRAQRGVLLCGTGARHVVRGQPASAACAPPWRGRRRSPRRARAQRCQRARRCRRASCPRRRCRADPRRRGWTRRSKAAATHAASRKSNPRRRTHMSRVAKHLGPVPAGQPRCATADPEIAATHRARRSRGRTTASNSSPARTSSRRRCSRPWARRSPTSMPRGCPGKRYYGGCEVVDQVEQLAIDRAKQLFGAEHANVQPHSGARPTAPSSWRSSSPATRSSGMDLSQGGHLTHGSPVNFSGLLYRAVSYGVTDDGLIDYDDMRRQGAREHRPNDHRRVQRVFARRGLRGVRRRSPRRSARIFMVDMAHFAGLVAAGVHPSPVPHADIVTTTTHKTLRGPRGGLILCKAEHAKAIDKAVFPGIAGRTARARDRRQGRGFPRGARAGVHATYCSAGRRATRGRWPRRSWTAGSRSCPAARTTT